MTARWLGLGMLPLLLVPPLAAGEGKDPDVGKSFQVPYRRSATQHVVVRAKINGKGPYNFLIDTGAPTLYVTTDLCRKLHVEPDKRGWGTFDRFEIEGGVVLKKAPGRVEDPFQLEGMNGMGLAGIRLHGIIGYTVLARYRLQFDFTKDKMVWTRLDFDPPAPVALGAKGEMPAALNAIGDAMKVIGAILGKEPTHKPLRRGFLGIELSEAAGKVTIKSVLPGSPAERAGLQAGDHVRRVQEKKVMSVADVHRLAANRVAGETVKLTIERGSETKEIAVTTGEGL